MTEEDFVKRASPSAEQTLSVDSGLRDLSF